MKNSLNNQPTKIMIMKKRTKRTRKSIQVNLNQSLWFALTMGIDLCPCSRLNHVTTNQK